MILLQSERIHTLCGTTAKNIAIQVVEETGSTNSDLLAQLDQLIAPALLVAHRQTAGRGRLGRHWYSHGAEALTFSLAWPFYATPQQIIGLPLVVGLSFAKAFHSLNVPVLLKWPNDILKEDKKLAGILVETSVKKKNNLSLTWAVIGVGMNLVVPDALENIIGHPVADARWLAHMDRHALIATFLNYLSEALTQFQTAGFAPFQAQWNAVHAFQNKLVVILDKGVVLQEGIALGVDRLGRLVLETQTGQQTILAGDVSLRMHSEQKLLPPR